MFDYLPYVFAAAGVLFALAGVRRTIATRRFEARASQAGAQVTDVRERWVSGSDSRNRRVWVPVVRFTTADGRTVEAETGPHRGLRRPHAGDPLEVLYDPADPADVRLRSGAGGIVAGVVSVAFGVLFALLALTVVAR
jgi:hypothetical protein